MNPSPTAQFAAACGADAPVHLRIDRADGVRLTEGELDLPCALVGRIDDCEITLLDEAVSLRHAAVQVVGGRVLVADLGSRGGLVGAAGKAPFAWLSPETPVRIGPFKLSTLGPVSDRPKVPDPTWDPFVPHAKYEAGLPPVTVRFLNGKSARAEWAVNRAVTFLGRSEKCKVHLAADEVAPFHCYFVHTPMGLWVVDLVSPTGILVNGERVRYAHLADGDVLQVSRFRLGFRCKVLATVPVPRPKPVPVPVPAPNPAPAPLPLPVPDPTPLPPQPGPAHRLYQPAHTELPGVLAPVPGAMDAALAPLVSRMTDVQGQMVEQFRSSLMGVMETFGQMHREQMESMQREIARMAELTAEMAKLQTQLALPAAPANHLPVPEELPAVSEESAGHHNWVYERMNSLDQERRGIWQKVFGMLTPRPAGV